MVRGVIRCRTALLPASTYGRGHGAAGVEWIVATCCCACSTAACVGCRTSATWTGPGVEACMAATCPSAAVHGRMLQGQVPGIWRPIGWAAAVGISHRQFWCVVTRSSPGPRRHRQVGCLFSLPGCVLLSPLHQCGLKRRCFLLLLPAFGPVARDEPCMCCSMEPLSGGVAVVSLTHWLQPGVH